MSSARIAEYTAILKQSGPWWVGWIEEVPGVNCQEPTREELIASLEETLREALDGAFSRSGSEDVSKIVRSQL